MSQRVVRVPILAHRRTWNWIDKHGRRFQGRKSAWITNVLTFNVGSHPELVGGAGGGAVDMYDIHMVNPEDPEFPKDVTLLAGSEEEAIAEARSRAMGIVALGGGGRASQLNDWVITARKFG